MARRFNSMEEYDAWKQQAESYIGQNWDSWNDDQRRAAMNRYREMTSIAERDINQAEKERVEKKNEDSQNMGAAVGVGTAVASPFLYQGAQSLFKPGTAAVLDKTGGVGSASTSTGAAAPSMGVPQSTTVGSQGAQTGSQSLSGGSGVGGGGGGGTTTATTGSVPAGAYLHLAYMAYEGYQTHKNRKAKRRVAEERLMKRLQDAGYNPGQGLESWTKKDRPQLGMEDGQLYAGDLINYAAWRQRYGNSWDNLSAEQKAILADKALSSGLVKGEGDNSFEFVDIGQHVPTRDENGRLSLDQIEIPRHPEMKAAAMELDDMARQFGAQTNWTPEEYATPPELTGSQRAAQLRLQEKRGGSLSGSDKSRQTRRDVYGGGIDRKDQDIWETQQRYAQKYQQSKQAVLSGGDPMYGSAPDFSQPPPSQEQQNPPGEEPFFGSPSIEPEVQAATKPQVNESEFPQFEPSGLNQSSNQSGAKSMNNKMLIQPGQPQGTAGNFPGAQNEFSQGTGFAQPGTQNPAWGMPSNMATPQAVQQLFQTPEYQARYGDEGERNKAYWKAHDEAVKWQRSQEGQNAMGALEKYRQPGQEFVQYGASPDQGQPWQTPYPGGAAPASSFNSNPYGDPFQTLAAQGVAAAPGQSWMTPEQVAQMQKMPTSPYAKKY